MSLLDQLADSAALKVNRSADFDQFRSIERLADARSIPLGLKGFVASFATVALKSCTIYLQLTFPRILQATYRTGGAMVGFGMDDAVSVVVNGIAASPPTILLARGSAPCEIVEPRANLIAFINFDAIDGRGWPGQADSAMLIPTRSAEFEGLRSVTRDVLTLASNTHAFSLPHLIENLEESVLQAVDRVIHAAPAIDRPRSSLTQYLALVRRLDEFLSQNASQTLYSADVARELGVSVRTLHNAVVAIRGMSMHRYVRLRRLWNVRQQLVQGSSTAVIRAIALANGFWHMGEFGSLYRTTFGETPQETLAAARSQHG